MVENIYVSSLQQNVIDWMRSARDQLLDAKYRLITHMYVPTTFDMNILRKEIHELAKEILHLTDTGD